MDFNATVDLIIKDLDEAREIIDDLKKYPGVPVLQVELAKSKCKSAGEVIALLKTFGDNSRLVPDESAAREKEQNKKLQESKKTAARHVNLNAPQEIKKKETIQIVNTPSSADIIKEPKKIPAKETQSTIIADKFSDLANSFNEQLGNLKNDDDLSDFLKTKILTSLSEAIGLNDKFLFIREIFKGDQNAYIQAISRLESAESLKDAKAVIMSYTGDSSENEAVNQLLNLVKRKLLPHE